jgi:hypothetical protein
MFREGHLPHLSVDVVNKYNTWSMEPQRREHWHAVPDLYEAGVFRRPVKQPFPDDPGKK